MQYGKHKVVPNHAIKVQRMEVQLHSFFNSTLERWSPSCPGCFAKRETAHTAY